MESRNRKYHGKAPSPNHKWKRLPFNQKRPLLITGYPSQDVLPSHIDPSFDDGGIETNCTARPSDVLKSVDSDVAMANFWNSYHGD